MNPSKRQRSVGEDDVSEHTNKKTANSDEQRLLDQHRPAALSSGCTLSAPMEPMNTPQDAETAGVTIDNPLGSPQDADTATINADDQLEGPRDKATNYGDDVREQIAILEKRTHKLKEKNKKLTSKSYDAARMDIILQKRMRRLERRTKKWMRKSYDVDIKTIENQRDKLQDKLKTAQDKLELVQNNLGAVQKQLEAANKQNEQLAEDIERIGIARHSAPDLDNALELQFLDLRETVRSFTRELCDRQISTSSIPDSVRVALTALTGLPINRLLKSGLHARYLVEGLIWRLLCENIFENPFFIWGNTNIIGKTIDMIQSGSDVPLPYRELWRTITGQLLNNRQPPESKIKYYHELLVSYLMPLISVAHQDSFKNCVEPILKGTIELAKALAQSRTLCACQRKDLGADDNEPQMYNSTWMEVVEKSINHYEDIDFLVTPALIQLTNSAGDEFKSPRVIVKAEVCFGQGRTSTSIHPTSEPPPDVGGQVKTTLSGRQARAVERLGKPAEERHVIEVIGNDSSDDRD